MLTDHTVIHRRGRFEVLGQRYEVQFKCGVACWLHLVHENGADSMFLRALVDPAARRVQVFDLRHIAPVLDPEIRQTQARDVAGLVFFTLRAVYASCKGFRISVNHHACETWSTAKGELPQPLQPIADLDLGGVAA